MFHEPERFAPGNHETSHVAIQGESNCFGLQCLDTYLGTIFDIFGRFCPPFFLCQNYPKSREDWQN